MPDDNTREGDEGTLLLLRAAVAAQPKDHFTLKAVSALVRVIDARDAALRDAHAEVRKLRDLLQGASQERDKWFGLACDEKISNEWREKQIAELRVRGDAKDEVVAAGRKLLDCKVGFYSDNEGIAAARRELREALSRLDAAPQTEDRHLAPGGQTMMDSALDRATEAAETVLLDWKLNYPSDRRIAALELSSDCILPDLRAMIIQAVYTAIERTTVKMVDYAKVKEALDQSMEETRRYLRAQGAAAERASIVAWLKSHSNPGGYSYQALADRIERGEHARPEPARREDNNAR